MISQNVSGVCVFVNVSLQAKSHVGFSRNCPKCDTFVMIQYLYEGELQKYLCRPDTDFFVNFIANARTITKKILLLADNILVHGWGPDGTGTASDGQCTNDYPDHAPQADIC